MRGKYAKWLDVINPNSQGKVIELNYFESDGVRYESSNSTLRYNKKNEKYFSQLLREIFNLDVSEVPRIESFDNHGYFISTPDNIFDSEQGELKSISGSGESTFVDVVNRGSKQANNLFAHILDKSELTEDMIETHIILLFKYKKYEPVEKIAILSRTNYI